MPSQDFIVLNQPQEAGVPLVLDGINGVRGYQTTCTFCARIIARDMPDGSHPVDVRPRYSADLRLGVLPAPNQPGMQFGMLSLPVDVCDECAPGVFAPFGALLRERGLPIPWLDELADAVGDLVAAAAAAVDDEPATVDDPGQAGLAVPAAAAAQTVSSLTPLSG